MTQVNVSTQVNIGPGGSGGGEAGFMILALLAWAIWMVFYPSYWLATHLYYSLRITGMHPLFAGIIAGIPTVFTFAMLWLFREFRFLYFGIDTMWATMYVNEYVRATSDPIWAGFFALLTFVACSVATYFIATAEALPDVARRKFTSEIFD